MAESEGNLLEDRFPAIPEELFETLLEAGSTRIERIVSTGQATPIGHWYDQDWDEWVLLVQGNAGLWLEGEPAPRHMRPGDYVFLPAHRRHRVEWTDLKQATVWLAVHLLK